MSDRRNKNRTKQPPLKERMNRISEGTNETEDEEMTSPKMEPSSRKSSSSWRSGSQRSSSSGSSSNSSPQDIPHLWKEEGGSAEDNVARRTSNDKRGVTFSPELLGKRISYFSVQKPWVQRTFRGSSPGAAPLPVDESVDDSIYNTDESLLKNTVESSLCDTTKSSPTVETKPESTFEEQTTPAAVLTSHEEVETVDSRDDEESSDALMATALKFKDSLEDVSQVDQSNSNEVDQSQHEFKHSLNEDPSESSPTISPNRRMSLLSGGIYEPPTNLHDVCYNAQSPNDIASFQDIYPGTSPGQNKMKEISIAASQRDAKGRTPLHLVSQNHCISSALYPVDDDSIPGLQPSSSAMTDASCAEKKQVATFVLDVLLAANPMAMKLQDCNGHIPFERALVEWIHIMHNCDSPKGRPWGLGSRRFSSYSKLSAPSRIQHMWYSTSHQVSSAMAWAGKSLPFTSASARSLGTVPDNSSPKKTDDIEGGLANQDDLGLSNIEEERDLSDDASWALDHFPSHVQLTSHVKYAIELLSTILDHLDEYVLSRSFRRRTMKDRRSAGSNQTRDSFDVAMDEFRDFCFSESADVIAADIIDRIAAIPYLIKTLVRTCLWR